MGGKDAIVKIVLFIFVGALFVLVIKNASSFATATTAVGGQVSNFASGLSGSGFGGTSGSATQQQAAAGGQPAKKAA